MPGFTRLASLPSTQPMRRHRLLLLSAALLLTACASTVAPPSDQATAAQAKPTYIPPPVPVEERVLRSVVSLQDRLYRVAAPLLISNTQLCKNNARNLLGFTAKNKYSYSPEFVNAAQNALQLNERLQVMGVLTGSGAARAGLQHGDKLIAVESKPMPAGENAERQASALLAPLVTGRTSVKLTVERSGSENALIVPLTYACAFGLELGNTGNVTAYADGHRVLITHGMMNFAQSDEELAYVIAKEMAHNALSHAARLRVSATIGGIIDNLTRVRPDMSAMAGLGGVKPMPRDLDAMADKLSLYMLARAGYNIDQVVPFWQRMASQYPATVLTAYTALHPATAYRVTIMQKTVADIKAKQAAKKPLLP